ncbi:MAG: imidazolonepropionase-like amidohydrolase [Gammaproteobacteria bacterium]|jgi:imidazolonepropionase-like amidohydrolase
MSMRTLIKAPRLFDAITDRSRSQAFVIVDGENIETVGSQQDLDGSSLEQFDQVIELPANSTLLPGLINMHTHLSFSSSLQVFHDATTESEPVKLIRIVENMRKCLRTGVTTVRDCGTWPHLALPVRDAVEQGLLPGPRIVASGAITSTGGHCWFCATEADSETEIRKAVRTHAKDGVDFIKLFATGGNTTPGSNSLVAQYTERELCAATEEARKAGRRTAAHAHALEGVRHSITARVTTIEHCSFQTAVGIGWDEDLASETLDAGIYVCHTVFRGIGKLEQDSTHTLTEAEARIIENRRTSTAARLLLTRRLAEKGISLIAGNDAGVMHVGFEDFPGDLVMASEGCDMSASAVLKSATSVAAQALGRADIGTIEARKAADLLVVHGDPANHIRDIERTAMVFTRGACVIDNRASA